MATLEQTRLPIDDQALILNGFDPLAVPQAPSLSLRSAPPALDEHDDEDLIDLGQEQLFAGTRSRKGNEATAKTTSTAAAAAAAPLVGTPTTVSEESLGQLDAAKVAFLSALQGLLQPRLVENEPSSSSRSGNASYLGSSAVTLNSSFPRQDHLDTVAETSDSTNAPEVAAADADAMLASLVDNLRLHVHSGNTGPGMTQSLTSVSPLLGTSGTAAQAAARPLLVNELQARVDALAHELSPTDAQLARALGALLACIERLTTIAHIPLLNSSDQSPLASTSASTVTPRALSPDPEVEPSATNVYERLEREARALQMSKNDVPLADARALASVFGAAREVERAERDLLWGRIDDLSERVRTLCRQRADMNAKEELDASDPTEELGADVLARQSRLTQSSDQTSNYAPSIASGSELPTYSNDGHAASADTSHLPPAYFADYVPDFKSEQGVNVAATGPARRVSHTHNEKMQRDLDSVSHAIERLYAVSPQLANQRVEPDRRKLRERQLAKLGNAIERLSKGRLDDQRAAPISPVDEDPTKKVERNQRIQEVMLDKLIDQINRAASRTLTDQRVDLNGKQKDALLNAGTMKGDRFELLDPGEAARREFILEHTGKGRLASQEAVLHSHHPFEAFPGPPLADRASFSDALFAADYSLNGHSSEQPTVKKRFSNLRMGVFKRPASLSTSRRGSYDARMEAMEKAAATGPSISRRGSYDTNAIRTPDGATGLGVLGLNMSRRGSVAHEILPISAVDYLAEESRNLGTLVISFWPRVPTSAHQDWEVTAVEGDSILVAPAAGGPSSRLALPSRVIPQQVMVTSHGSFCEAKLMTLEPSPTRSRPDLEVHAPLSTTELRNSLPSSFACVTCHAEVAETSRVTKYNSLPSEHWAELLDAWMCHQDQTLSDDLVAKGKGIKPREGEGLVGSKHIVFDAGLVKNWRRGAELGEPERTDNGDTLHPAQCTSCSSLIGFDVAPADTADVSTPSFRLLKLAAYPISVRVPGSALKDAPRYGLASHVTAELLELGQAHACHRFIVEDREHDKARLLLWLFNPSVRVSFSTAATASSELLQDPMPRTSSLQGASELQVRRSMNAVKIFFIVVEDEDEEKCREFIASPMSTCERVQYPLSITTRLTELLRASSSIYPVSKRRWGDHEVGFLERL